jgi:hypothetical protein
MDASGTPVQAVLSCVGMQGMSKGVMSTDGVFVIVSTWEYIVGTSILNGLQKE